ncbi:hypothetical protein [Helicobacter pylori]|nr:hypothetical protein [Helicobacter pylori]
MTIILKNSLSFSLSSQPFYLFKNSLSFLGVGSDKRGGFIGKF